MQLGTRVVYKGTVSPLSLRQLVAGGVGTLVGTRPTDRWGDDAVVKLDDGRTVAVPPSALEAVSP